MFWRGRFKFLAVSKVHLNIITNMTFEHHHDIISPTLSSQSPTSQPSSSSRAKHYRPSRRGRREEGSQLANLHFNVRTTSEHQHRHFLLFLLFPFFLLNNVCNTTVLMLALEAKINVSCRVNVIINSFAIISINSNKREMMVYF